MNVPPNEPGSLSIRCQVCDGTLEVSLRGSVDIAAWTKVWKDQHADCKEQVENPIYDFPTTSDDPDLWVTAFKDSQRQWLRTNGIISGPPLDEFLCMWFGAALNQGWYDGFSGKN